MNAINLKVFIATAGICAMIIAAIGFGSTPRSVSAASAQNLGTVGSGSPSCPIGPKKDPDCYVLYTVTGFQTLARGKKSPFLVKKDGKLVAWSIKLGKPTKQQRQRGAAAFGTPALGGHPAVRMVVLAPVKNKKNSFRLVRQTPIVKLNGFYGSTATITLNEPLNVKKGHIIGITALTWVPNLVTYDRAGNSAWRASASNKDNNCKRPSSNSAEVRAKYKVGPHREAGTKRKYDCKFGDLLLYSAHIAPKVTGSPSGEPEPAELITLSGD